MTSDRQMRLGAFLFGLGHHLAAWRHPEADPSALTRFEPILRSARLAEAAAFDAVFFADNVGLPGGSLERLSQGPQVYYWEPLTLLAALATQTERIGLICTVSATYMPPYHLARKFASLDQLSGGRTGWNLVTSASDAEAQNFGLEHQLAHDDRYARAAEYLQVVTGLWDTWDDDALVLDKAAGRFFDPTKVRRLDHEGPYYRVRGPLQSGRPVQGRPVIVQAGSSDDGRALAGVSAEVVFTAQQSLPGAQAFYADIKARAVAAGRDPADVLIMPGVMPFVAETREAAEARFQSLQDLVDVRQALGLLSGLTGTDLSRADLDGPFPDLPPTEGWRGRQELFRQVAEDEGLNLRQLMYRAVSARGHKVVVGSPQDVADMMQQWFEAGAADGFNVMPPILPGDLEAFTRLVVPELRRRGLFRDAYEGVTLRDHLGLKRPAVGAP
ncbi:LLM class flavin-dependent oxidoreductase [Phenylobacterium sp.]|uniref:LLM class flavin-dependent oxidoreductase n=1 Tax=Phenylobacterium sp. TaxID=1871053 RepID=UPI00301DCF69